MKLSIRGSLPVVLLEEFGARGRERKGPATKPNKYYLVPNSSRVVLLRYVSQRQHIHAHAADVLSLKACYSSEEVEGGKKQQWKMQRGMRRNGRVVKRKRTTALLSTSQVISASHILLLCPTLVSLINQSFMGDCTMSKI